MKKKADLITELTQQIDELRSETSQLRASNGEKDASVAGKAAQIALLESQLRECEAASGELRAAHRESIEKIEVLEGEIKAFVKQRDGEMDELIQKNSHLAEKYERLSAKHKSQCEKVDAIRAELDALRGEHEAQGNRLAEETAKLSEKDSEHRKLLDENIQLLEGMEQTKKQAEDDMLSYAMESKKLLAELQVVKDERSKIITELCRKEELLNEMQDELNNKLIDVDAERDEIKEALNAEFAATVKKYEQQIATLREVHEMKVKEIESVAVLERAQLAKEHKEALAAATEAHAKEVARIGEQAEEKIRIAEVQMEQRLKGIEATVEHAMQSEKEQWRAEIDKCQKIAEREIMQCEFEKQDLKTLLESANELMREKDESIQELQSRADVAGLARSRDEIEAELKEAQLECSRLSSEQHKYQMALSNTRSTANILMERLRKSDHDVEVLKEEVEALTEQKLDTEATNVKLSNEIDEYRHALAALRSSSLCLEREMLEKELVFEKIMSSEQETLETVNRISKLFSDKLEDNISKYADLYNDLKRKYDAREAYIKDMKALLEEFATGIELARLELDMKDRQLTELQSENKNIKLETLTYKFKCEQFEKYAQEQRAPHPTPDLVDADGKVGAEGADDSMVSNQMIERIIVQLEKEVENECLSGSIAADVYSDEDKIAAENVQLKEKLSEKMRQIDFLQEIVEIENSHATENVALRRQVSELEQKMTLVEKFANETVEKCTEMASAKKIEKLMDKNASLKNVSGSGKREVVRARPANRFRLFPFRRRSCSCSWRTRTTSSSSQSSARRARRAANGPR